MWIFVYKYTLTLILNKQIVFILFNNKDYSTVRQFFNSNLWFNPNQWPSKSSFIFLETIPIINIYDKEWASWIWILSIFCWYRLNINHDTSIKTTTTTHKSKKTKIVRIISYNHMLINLSHENKLLNSKKFIQWKHMTACFFSLYTHLNTTRWQGKNIIAYQQRTVAYTRFCIGIFYLKR
jgi:hypothetical protein